MKTLRAHGFNQQPRFEQVVGYIERGEPLPLDPPDRNAVTSHFYLDDFVQSSEDPNPQPLQHTPLQAIPEEGFRTPAEATDEDVRLARIYRATEATTSSRTSPATPKRRTTARPRPRSRTGSARRRTAPKRQRIWLAQLSARSFPRTQQNMCA